MSRMIDADALKEYIDMQKGRPFIGCTVGEALKIMVDEQPTVTQWIPCSRELPKKNGTYIVKCERNGEQYYDMLDFDATMIAMKWNTTAKVLKWCEIPKEADK